MKQRSFSEQALQEQTYFLRFASGAIVLQFEPNCGGGQVKCECQTCTRTFPCRGLMLAKSEKGSHSPTDQLFVHGKLWGNNWWTSNIEDEVVSKLRPKQGNCKHTPHGMRFSDF
jgi:hypothetical protein